MIGIDLSEEMLDIARYEHPEEEMEILYLHQDMREFELFGTVSAIVSLCDSMNYITSEEDLLKVFRLVNNYLDKDGLFIFDMNTLYKHKVVLGNSFYKSRKRGVVCNWANRLLDDGVTVEITLELTYKTGIFKKETVCEIIKERAYTDNEINEALNEAGFNLEAVYGENTLLPPKEDSERNIYVARKVK